MPNVRDRPHFKKVIEFAQASEVADKHALDLHKPIWAVHAICTQPQSKKIHHAIIVVVSTYHTGVDSKMPTIAVMARRGTWPECVAANPSCNTKRKQLLERLPMYPDEASPVWYGGRECERHILNIKPQQEKQATPRKVANIPRWSITCVTRRTRMRKTHTRYKAPTGKTSNPADGDCESQWQRPADRGRLCLRP